MKKPRTTWPLKNSPRSKPCESVPISKIVDRNIRLVDEHRRDNESAKGFEDHLADFITQWSGSMLFIYFHVLWFGLWIAANLGWFGIKAFDPFPYGLLTTIVSLEAIFLSTFVLVSQNRQADLADRRAELDLQINLLAEYEMTRVLTLVDAIARKLEVTDCDDKELAELEEDIEPKELLKELDRRAKKHNDIKQK